MDGLNEDIEAIEALGKLKKQIADKQRKKEVAEPEVGLKLL